MTTVDPVDRAAPADQAGPADPVAVTPRPASTRALWLLVAVLVLAALMVSSLAFGSRAVAWSDVWAALGGADDTLEQAAATKRIPRTVLAIVIGGALGLAGAVMQGVTRNPLADPGILGVNMGASLAVVSAVAFFGLTSPTGYIWVATSGAAVSALFVYVVGALGRGGATPLKLALAGAATSAAFASLVSAVVLPRNDIAGSFRLWQIGGVGGASFERIGHVLPFLVAGFALCLLSARGLNSSRWATNSRPASANASPSYGPWPRSAPSSCAARPPRSPGRSRSSASSYRTPAAC